jgi:hypothetical protein
MLKDYEEYFKTIGLSDEEEKRIVLEFVDTLFELAITGINNDTDD